MLPALLLAAFPFASLADSSDDPAVLLVPQLGAIPLHGAESGVRLDGVNAACQVGLNDAATELAIALTVEGTEPSRAVLWLPLPAEPTAVAVHSGTGPDAVEVEHRLIDPGRAPDSAHGWAVAANLAAPLEFAGHRLLETEAIELPPGESTLVVRYEHGLPDLGADPANPSRAFELPRSETPRSLEIPWVIDVRVKLRAELADVYCPTHQLDRERVAHDELRLSTAAGRHAEPGSLVLLPMAAAGDINTLLLAWPMLAEDPAAGGYFALVAAPSPAARSAARDRTRELTFVLDTSGSMAGEKFEQAREAARQVLENLRASETFNIILYDTEIEPLFAEPQLASTENIGLARDFLARAETGGGTNIDGALRQALRAEPSPDHLPLVLFLTDGLPTSGITSEREILANVDQRNGAERRIFTFGVGDDLNAPLLDALATRSGAQPHFVRPGEDIEQAVGTVLDRLTGGVLSRPRLRAVDSNDRTLADAIESVLPERLPDLFADDQLAILGHFTGAEPIDLELSGRVGDEPVQIRTTLDPSRALGGNSFVAQLWAGRRNGALIDAIRAGGAGGDTPEDLHARTVELLRLALRFGAMTEYTSFLALEGPGSLPPAKWFEMTVQLLTDRALRARVGRAAVTQAINTGSQRMQRVLNRTGRHLDANSKEVLLTGVIPLGDRGYFLREETWVDSRLLEPGARREIDVEVAFGSEEHRGLTAALADRGEVAILGLALDQAIHLEGRNILVRRP